LISFKSFFLWRVLQQLRQKVHFILFNKKVVEHSYCGEKLKVLITDGLAQGWYDHDIGNLFEIELLQTSRLRPGATVFDLGAHQGVVGMILARKILPNGKVICVEPNPHNFHALQKNIELNEFNHIYCIQSAIGEAEGELFFNSGLNGAATVVKKYGRTFKVNKTTVNHLVKEFGNPDVVFMDIEGFEEKALTAASKALSLPCDFFIEVHVGSGLESVGGNILTVLEFFPASKYNRFVHHDNGVPPIKIEDADKDFFKERFFLTALAK
jgi:FkbM family methyltransferase